MTPIDIVLYSQISALCSQHQRGFLLQQKGTNRPRARHYAESKTLEHIALIKPLPSELRELVEKEAEGLEEREGIEDTWRTEPFKNN